MRAILELVPAAHEAEARVTVDVVRGRRAVAHDESLHGVEVRPDGLLCDELRDVGFVRDGRSNRKHRAFPTPSRVWREARSISPAPDR